MFKDTLLLYYKDLGNNELELLNEYYILLSRYGAEFNLTAITEETEVAIKHFYDSLLFNDVLDLSARKENNILDLGTGAGFPGLVLAIMNSQCSFTLIDAVNKKVNFVKTVAEQLGLTNIRVIHARSEAVGQDKEFRETFDLGVARGVAYLPTLSEYLLPLIKVGGQMVLTKELPYENELASSANALAILGGYFKKATTYKLPVYGNERAFLFFDKIKNTPSKYPRREGVPSKKPL